jgi:signal transduction histidine kinase
VTRLAFPARLAHSSFAVTAASLLGLLATFGVMIAAGDAGRIGAIALVPWVALLGAELGIAAGGAAGIAATGVYALAAVLVGGPLGPLALAVRAAALALTGAAAGLAARRIAASEGAARHLTALQTALLDSTLDGICLTDRAGHVLISNAPLRRISVELGLAPTGTVPERLIAMAERTTEPERYAERMRTLAREPQTESVDEFELKGSGRVFRGYTAPVSDPDGSFSGRIWTLREVTADRDLERLRDAFVAAVSHELRTPLTSISGFLEMLADEEEALGETGRGYLNVIRRSTSRLQRIVEDLLLVAQIQADRLELAPEPADLAQLAAAAVESARPLAEEKEIALTLDADPALLPVDAQRVGQVLDNLVSNALKFTDRGGAVTVTVEPGAEWTRAAIADTGIGIPRDEQGQLFSRFFRASSATRRAIPGTGLGLVITRAIVEAHGGTISLESREGEGTRVTVALPTAPTGAS